MGKGKPTPIKILQYLEKPLPPKSARKKSNHEQASMNSITKEVKTRKYCSNQRFDTERHLENCENHRICNEPRLLGSDNQINTFWNLHLCIYTLPKYKTYTKKRWY